MMIKAQTQPEQVRSNQWRLNPFQPRAFTLVELLVVISIMGILFTLIVPSFNGILGANRLGTASEMVLGSLSSARQLATTKNRQIQVRLLVFTNPDFPSLNSPNNQQIRGIQLMQVEESGAVTGIEKPRLFPNGIISGTTLINGTSMSTLAIGTGTNPTTSDPSVSTIGKNYSYYFFYVTPDGSFTRPDVNMPLSGSNYYLTLYDEKYFSVVTGSLKLPSNFSTIQIDPFTGDAILYQP